MPSKDLLNYKLEQIVTPLSTKSKIKEQLAYIVNFETETGDEWKKDFGKRLSRSTKKSQ